MVPGGQQVWRVTIGKLLMADKLINQYLNKNQLEKLLLVKTHIGNAPERARQLVKIIRVIPAKAGI